MRSVKCYDCGKRYDYDRDDFCPGCGAFNLPARESRIGADGSVVWVDGINARNHAESFVHAEFHSENKKRRGSRLESQPGQRRTAAARLSNTSGQKAAAKKSGGSVLKWVILAIVGINLFRSLLFSIF